MTDNEIIKALECCSTKVLLQQSCGFKGKRKRLLQLWRNEITTGRGLKSPAFCFQKNIKNFRKIIKKVVDFLITMCYIIITPRATAQKEKELLK